MGNKRAGKLIHHKHRQGAFALFTLLLAIAIILFLSYLVLSVYLKQFPFPKTMKESLSEHEKISEYLSEHGLEPDTDSPDYKTNLDSTRKAIENLDKQLLNRTRQLRDFR
jgi:hypothetical protein